MQKITGLWKSETTTGDEMFSGNLSPMARIVILPNKFKKKETDPDYILFIAPAGNGGAEKEETKTAPAEATSDDDVLF